MKHDQIVNQLLKEAERNPNTLGLLLFGSVAAGTNRETSDIDLLTVMRTSRPSSGMNHTTIDEIQVGNIFFTYEILVTSVETVPYLLHPLVGSKLLFDREGLVKPLYEQIIIYFAEHPEITAEWARYNQLLREEKARYGFEQTTIVDVWNELEKRYSGGKIKRPFFNFFYMTNPRIFSILKKLLASA